MTKRNDITPADASMLGRIDAEVGLIPGYDQPHRFAMRKLGNIHLGVKQEKGFPKATDYFVLPDDLLKDKPFRDALTDMGEDPDRPKKLPIMLMSNDIGQNLVSSKDLFGQNGKLKCRSYDGQICEKLNDKTLQYERKPCDKDCIGCAWRHRFRFLLPDSTRFGYWQVVSTSPTNRGGLLRAMIDAKALLGRLVGIDFVLRLSNEREFRVPMQGKSGTTLSATKPYLLYLETSKSLREIIADRGAAEPLSVEDDIDNVDELVVDQATGEILEPDAAETESEPQAVADDVVVVDGIFDESTDDTAALESLRKDCKQIALNAKANLPGVITTLFGKDATLDTIDGVQLESLRGRLEKMAGKIA